MIRMSCEWSGAGETLERRRRRVEGKICHFVYRAENISVGRTKNVFKGVCVCGGVSGGLKRQLIFFSNELQKNGKTSLSDWDVRSSKEAS